MKKVNQRKPIIIGSHSYVEFKKQNRGSWGKRGKNKMKSEREINNKRLLIIGNKQGCWRGGGWEDGVT